MAIIGYIPPVTEQPPAVDTRLALDNTPPAEAAVDAAPEEKATKRTKKQPAKE